MPDVPEDPSTLIGDEDRENAVRRVQDAYAEGRVSHEDMTERLDRVLSARTRDELAKALTSLPAEKAPATSTIGAFNGRIKRRGAWRVPRNLKVESAFGRVRLDLSRAVIEHPVVDIEMRLGTGSATITVPRDAVVDIEDLKSSWKPTLYKAARRARPGAGPTIRISGAMGFGRLKIRHARR
ncbi:DUF1707 domain-containing protein [Actinomadura syzygii]|uniref:DUF1707 domain-containing protein n=1 Tax=Actinomadura syzygii TaxID=1427538 RepID=A0A5D0UAI9_9ACTN|nr:DUF1707 domain-containing protein [Actinomadura syzygii]TYC15107.1 DUF1707 domain-containing protein [Actinomadura syzygii]